MILCINPHCSHPQNSDNMKFCQGCGSELLLQGRYQVIRQLESDDIYKKLQINDVGSNTPKILKILINSHPKLVEEFQEAGKVVSSLNNFPVSLGEVNNLTNSSNSNSSNNNSLNHNSSSHNSLNNYFLYFPRDSKEGLHCLVTEEVKNLNSPQTAPNNNTNNSINNSNNQLITQTSIPISKDNQQTSDDDFLDDFLWQQWILTSTVAIHFAFFIAFILRWILTIEIVPFIAFVAILSLSQWFVLREHIKNTTGWFLANLVVFGLPYFIKSLLQKQPTKVASHWVLANALGICIGFLGDILVENLLKFLFLNEFIAATIALTVGSIMYGVITGRSLQKIIKQII